MADYQHLSTPTEGETITMTADGLRVPDRPIVPFIEGDGIGPDIWAAASRVLDAAVESAYGGSKQIEWFEVYAGEKAHDRFGEWLPEDTLTAMAEHLVSIKGPLTTPVGGGIRSLNVALRQRLDLYACVRPVRYFTGVPSPVKEPEKVDMVIFRENTEDIYAGIEFEEGTEDAERFKALLKENFPERYQKIRFPDTVGLGIKPVSQEGTARLVRAAMEYAVSDGRDSVTLVHKGNIMKFTEGAFRDWGYELADAEYGAEVLDGGPWRQFTKDGVTVTVKDVIADAFLAADPDPARRVRRDRDAEPQRRLRLGRAGGRGRRHRDRAGRQHQLHDRRGAVRGHARDGAQVRRPGQGEPVERDPVGRDDAPLHGLDRGRRRHSFVDGKDDSVEEGDLRLPPPDGGRDQALVQRVRRRADREPVAARRGFIWSRDAQYLLLCGSPSAQMTFEQRVQRLVEIQREISAGGGISTEALEPYKAEHAELRRGVMDDLMWQPGSLIHLPDPVKLQEARKAVDMLWSQVSADELFDELHSGGFSGLLAGIMDDYTRRAAQLKPAFISVEPPNNEFRRYYVEAMRCWLFDLNGAAVILCCSILEVGLRDRLTAYDESRGNRTPYQRAKLWELIEAAYQRGLLDAVAKRRASSLAETRNELVHEVSLSPQSDDTLKMIESVRSTIEELYHRTL